MWIKSCTMLGTGVALQDLGIDPVPLQVSHQYNANANASTEGMTSDNVAGDATPATSTGSKRKPDCTECNRDVTPSKRP